MGKKNNEQVKSLNSKLENVKNEFSSNNVFDQVQKMLALENTRLIYSGIETLSRSFINDIWRTKVSGEDRYREIDKRYKDDKIFKQVKEKISNAINDDYEILRQNQLCNFINFLFDEGEQKEIKKSSGEDSSEKVLNKKVFSIAEMVRLFLLVTLLNEGWSKVAPYIYEDICTCMSNILDYKNCYIVELKNSKIKIIQQCSTVIHEKTRDFERKLRESSSEITKIILNSNEGCDKTLSFGTLSFGKESNKKHRVCVIRIEYISAIERDESEPRQFYFVLNDWDKKNGKDEWKLEDYRDVSRVLFLHRDIADNFGRDFHSLMNLRDDFSYICRLSNDSQREQPRILHISDTHIKKPETKKETDNKIKNLGEALKDNNDINPDLNGSNKKFTDLLLLTGDVIQGANTARDMEENYSFAEGVIFKIAETLWSSPPPFCNACRRLRADWKKRVLIIPGNQDYSSMNESKTTVDNRQTTASGVTKKPGSVMARFAYFIDFMRRRLDISIDFIDEKLNYIRKYDELNSTFICLNSCAAINPKRNNKVNLDFEITEKFEKLLEIDGKQHVKHYNYILMHHTPRYVFYDMNYFVDKYLGEYIEHLNKKDNETLQDIKDWFFSIAPTNSKLDTYFTNANQDLKNAFENLKEAKDPLNINTFNNNYEAIKGIFTEQREEAINSYPDKIIELCVNIIEDKEIPEKFVEEFVGELKKIVIEYKSKKENEAGVISYIKTEIISDFFETFEDKYEFATRIKGLIKCLCPKKEEKLVIFGGHTHKKSANKAYEEKEKKKNREQIEKIITALKIINNTNEIESIMEKIDNYEAGQFFNDKGFDPAAIIFYPS